MPRHRLDSPTDRAGLTGGNGVVRCARRLLPALFLGLLVLGGCGGRSTLPSAGGWKADGAVGGGDREASREANRESGALLGLWSQRAGRCLLVAPAVTESVLVTVSTDGRVQAWRVADGRHLWGRRYKFPIDVAPVIGRGAGEDVVVVAPRGKGIGLAALGLTRGKPRWQIRLDRPVVRLEARDTLLWVQDQGGTLAAHSLRDGRRQWSRSIGGWDSPPFLRDDARLLVAAHEDSLTALDAASGAVLWRAQPGGEFTVSPVRCGDRLVLTGESGIAVWLRAADGGLLGRSRRAVPQVSPGLPWRDKLVTVSGGGVAECAGLQESDDDWQRELECAVTAPPARVGERIYIATMRGALRALDPIDGDLLGVSQSRAGFRLAPIVLGARLFLADDKGYLHAYRY